MKRIVWLTCSTLTLLLSGCIPQPAKESVYINWAAVESAFAEPLPRKVPGQEEPAPAPGLKIEIPPLPATVLSNPKGKDEVQIQASIEAARLKARRQLQNRLREVYFQELDRQQEEAIAALNPAMAQETERARQKQMAVFHQYAEDKGFKLARLALLAGFPDPDPNSKNPKPEFAIAKRFRAEADSIRKDLKDLDARYDMAVQEILRNLEGSKDQMLTALKAKFVEARASAEERAGREASEQMTKLNKAFGQTLAEAREISVPGQPGKTLQAPPMDVRGKLPKLVPLPLAGSRESDLRNQLTIWKSVKGYRIVTAPSDGRDGTSEFLEWLRTHLPGP